MGSEDTLSQVSVFHTKEVSLLTLVYFNNICDFILSVISSHTRANLSEISYPDERHGVRDKYIFICR